MKENSRDPGTGEEWYRAVVEGLTEFVTRFRTDGTCIFANEAFCKYFGVSRTEIIGHRFRPDVPEEDRDLLSAYFDSFSSDHPVSTIEHRVRVPDGSIRWNLWTDWAFFDTEGHITEFQSVGQDITDHRRGQEALRESEARFGGLIERSPLGIVLLRGSKVLYANIKTRQLLRTDPDTVRQTGSFLDYIAPEAREEIAERNRRREQGEVVPNEYETIALRRDGTKFPCHVVVSGIEMPDGMATIAFLTDITERKQAEADISLLYAEMEQRVKERTAELTRATREMEAFSYSVSHDLRAPLRAIDGFSGILMERFGPVLPEEGAYYIRKVRENTLQMAALIDALLELSRFGRRELRKDVVNPYEVVREVTRELRPEMEGRDVEVITGVLPPCHADPVMLHQVFYNLLSNAIKFTRDREHAIITIGSITGTEGMVYYIQDNGVGFDMQYAGQLFEAFHRLHDLTRYKGTGIGLALVRRIIERHGGSIWVESTVGEGTTFFFTIAHEA